MAQKKKKAEKAVSKKAVSSSGANKRAEKFRNLSPTELTHQLRDLTDQLFQLKFRLKMGQTESLNKIRGLRKDIARIRTISRGRVLGVETAAAGEKR
ncbi:MAG: 50S ribosomal protein L29 [Acidobacteriales bacterium]|nr:50S ribosomal protein L29 [Terriglobales bacterium]